MVSVGLVADAAATAAQVFTGLLDEARMLLDMGIAPGSNNASRAIGYRQAMNFLKARAADVVWPCRCCTLVPRRRMRALRHMALLGAD